MPFNPLPTAYCLLPTALYLVLLLFVLSPVLPFMLVLPPRRRPRRRRPLAGIAGMAGVAPVPSAGVSAGGGGGVAGLAARPPRPRTPLPPRIPLPTAWDEKTCAL